jgi:Alkaline phosphatase PhoX
MTAAFLLAAAIASLGTLAIAGAGTPVECAPGSDQNIDDDPACYVVTTEDGADYRIRPLLSAGDRVPETGDPTLEYQMVGIPDGLGAYESAAGEMTVFMNHEFTKPTLSQPVVGGTQYRGAFVSKWMLDEGGNVLSGERAYDTVFAYDYSDPDNPVVSEYPAAQADNSAPAFGRFCSGDLVVEGFDRPIYFTNEETTGADSFDGKGGVTVAIFDNQLHTLPHLGRFSWENSLVMPSTGNRTVIMGMEDGPATPDNQLFMYVGTKVPSSSDPLERNGLNNGDLYVFVSTTEGKTSEKTFTSGTIDGEWVLIQNAQNLTDVQLEAAVDAVGAMTFIRPEDGHFNPQHKDEFFFVTTGGNAAEGNELGRLYTLHLNSGNVLGDAELHVVYNADEVIADGGDIAISPDNISASGDYLMINEDGTTQSRAVMAAKDRDGSVWRFDLTNGNWENRVDVDSATRVAELDPPGGDGTAISEGVWETSGIIDVGALFGEDAWLYDIQAHAPTAAPAPGTVEDGQLVLMTLSD